MGNFRKDLLVGKIGENKAEELLLKSSRTRGFIDVRNDIYFQNLDIDFLVERSDGRILKYEVKTDTQAHRTGNIVYEKTTSGNVGCLEKSHADFILYYLSESDEMYIFELSKLKSYISENSERLRFVPMGDAATGYLVKIEELCKEKVLKKLN